MLPLLMSSWVVELCGASGRASRVLWDASAVADVFVGLVSGFEAESAEVLMLRDRKVGIVRRR